MYSMPPYPYLATDYGTQLSLFTHHNWIGGFCIVGAGAHAAIFMVRDYDPASSYNNLLDRVIRHRDAIISHLNWVCIFLGFHSFGLYIHNDTMSALGRPQDMFSDTAIQLQPVFAQWIQNTHFAAPQFTAPNALAATSATWGGDLVAVGGKVAMMPISLGTSDFLVWLVLDQVKLRYMLEQLEKNFIYQLFMKLKFFKSHALAINVFSINMFEVMKNLSERVYQQVIPSFRLASATVLAKLTFGARSFVRSFVRSLPSYAWQKATLGKAQVDFSYLKTEMSDGKKRDTSETTREAMLKKELNFDFTGFKTDKPSHIKSLDTDFLTWLIGFIEGDGSFWTRNNNSEIATSFTIDVVNKRAEFEITQSVQNIRVLYYIRTKLGFGRICTFEKNGNTYCRWFTSKQENILRLVSLLNGNLILQKRREQFQKWVTDMNAMWDLTIQIKKGTCKISLQNAWLAGFAEADGGFHTNVKTNFQSGKRPKGGHYIKFDTRFYITQLGEINVLKDIQNLVGCTTKIGTLTNGRTKVRYNRLEITHPDCITLLLKYFTKFPLKGAKNIDLLRLARVHGYKNMQRVVTEKAAERLANILLKLQDPDVNNSITMEDFSTHFSNEEKLIFVDLPLNQRPGLNEVKPGG